MELLTYQATIVRIGTMTIHKIVVNLMTKTLQQSQCVAHAVVVAEVQEVFINL